MGKNKQERKPIAKNVNKKIKDIKFKASQILSKNYIHFKESFDYLTNDRTINASTEPNNSCYIQWLIIFYWLWFICFKVFQITLDRYQEFFSDFDKLWIKRLFHDILKSDNIVKYLGFDLLMQYFFLVDQFADEMKVIASLPIVIARRKAVKFDMHCSKWILDFKTIFNSEIIKTASGLDAIKLQSVVDEFLANTYMIKMPETLEGITLCNRIVIIKLLSSISTDYENANTIVGYTIMTMIHELGHFINRFSLKSDYSWLEKQTPERNNEKIEGGSDFIEKIFRSEPKTITLKASKYILNINNWAKLSDTFIKEFKKSNPYSEKDKHNPIKQRRLKQQITNIAEVIELNYCGKPRK